MIPSRRRTRAFTMVELLVTISILAFVLGAIIKVFMAGARFGRGAQEQSEAARIAQAVFDFADMPKATPTWGRMAIDGSISAATPTVTDTTTTSTWTYAVASSELDLVWEAKIEAPAPTDFDGLGTGIHYLIVTVYKDEDETYTVTPDDREIGKFYSILADR